MIDIHTHILPGIDDGAKDMETAIKMLKMAERDGTTHIIVTPHYIHEVQGIFGNDSKAVKKSYEELMAVVKEKNINVKIYPGTEAFICPELPQLITSGGIYTLNNSAYVLVELPMMNMPIYTDDVLFNIKISGYTPIIAHPERYREIADNPNTLYDYINRGALVQVNASSIKGIYGKKIKDTALTLIRHNMVHFVASDAHTCRGRSPKMSRAYEIVRNEVGDAFAKRLFRTNAMKILKDEEFSFPKPEKVRSWMKMVLSLFTAN